MTGVGFSPSCEPVSAVSPSYGSIGSDTLFVSVAAQPSGAASPARSVLGPGFPSSPKIARFQQ